MQLLPQKIFLRPLLVLTIFSLAVSPFSHLQPFVQPHKNVNQAVWGRKPVLEYFLLTPDLAKSLKRDTGISEEKISGLQGFARREASRLNAIHKASEQALLRTQTGGEQTTEIFNSEFYNRQVQAILRESEEAIQTLLEPGEFNRMVEWINLRWEIERRLHGVESITGGRSYQIYATRYDSGGSYTVALPDKCLKIANNGSHLCDDSGYAVEQEYSVKVQYQNSARVTVGESGPWNVDDNFWAGVGDPQPRRMFIDLPVGMPASQAAYFDDYNGGEDQFGRTVTSPVAIDLAREVSLDIGLEPGHNDWVTVTFLWTEGWSEQGAQVITLNEPTRLQPPYEGDMCGSAWHKISGYADRPAYLTLNVSSTQESTNRAEWRPDLPKAGRYRVQAFIPDHPPISWECPDKTIPRDTSNAVYRIIHSSGETSISGDQGPLANLWLDLGEYYFSAGGGEGVDLADLNNDEESYSHTVAFSAIRFVSSDEPAPTPEPSPTPTPQPPNPSLLGPILRTDPGKTVTASFWASYLVQPGLGELTLAVNYTPGLLTPTECHVSLSSQFDLAECDLDYERDGVSPDSLQIHIISPEGVSGDVLLAQVNFQVSGKPGQFSPLTLLPKTITSPSGLPLTLVRKDGMICIRPCRNILYFPMIISRP